MPRTLNQLLETPSTFVSKKKSSNVYILCFEVQRLNCSRERVEKSPSIKVHRVTDPPFKKKRKKFNFSQTVGEMVFVRFEVEKMRMFLVQSVIRWYCVGTVS